MNRKFNFPLNPKTTSKGLESNKKKSWEEYIKTLGFYFCLSKDYTSGKIMGQSKAKKAKIH